MNAIVSNKAETTNHRMMPFATKVPLEVYRWLAYEARVRKVTPSAVGREIFLKAYAERAGNRKRTPFERETPGVCGSADSENTLQGQHNLNNGQNDVPVRRLHLRDSQDGVPVRRYLEHGARAGVPVHRLRAQNVRHESGDEAQEADKEVSLK